MQQGSTNYYHPYDSYSDGSDDGGSTGSSGDDRSVLQERSAGPSFSTLRQVAQFTNQNQLQAGARGSLPYNEYVSSSTMTLPDSSFSDTGQSKFKTERKDVTTLFLVDSTNRDHVAFPQPTNFTLRPPRAYKTVTSIQITQLKLLCSFFYFQASKGNITLPVVELDRKNTNMYLEKMLTKAVTIREGTYAINDLLTEITTQLNYTPLFYDYPNGFTDFVTAFTTNGDYGVNFNEPGDTFYDTLNNKFISNPTKDYIVKAYWVTRYAGLTTYTVDQIKVAFYYPVLYEVLLDPEDTTAYPYLNLTLTNTTLNPGETVYIRVVFNSQGISDPVILELINNNITYLDAYRTYHTFRYSLVNRYQITYDANNLRINIFTLTLNTSLLNLFTKTNATSLAAALQQQGYTSNNYIALSNQLNQSQVVFSDMYNYIQNQLVKYFAIDYATYASQYFVNTGNILFIRNGFNASNIRSGYTLEYLTSGTQPLISTLTSYSNSPAYWPKFNAATAGSLAGGIDPSGINVSTNMIPYSITSSNFQFGNQSIDSSNYYVQTNQSTRSIDTIITIKPARYTVLKFRSPCRQTLQVETMPLPYYYKFADYNKQGLYSNVLDASNNNVPQKYFDVSYSFVYTTSGPNVNSYMDQSNYSSLQLSYPYGIDYLTSFISSPSLLLNVQSNLAQFKFTAPSAPVPYASTLAVYDTTLTFTSLTSSFPGTVLAFVYHDRAAFMADINSNYQRNEKPLHYIASNRVEANTTQNLTIHLSTFTGHSYYTIFRSETLSFQNINYVPSVYQVTSSFVAIKTDYVNFDPLGNPSDASNVSNYPFVTNYNTDYLRLPTSSTLQGIDPNNPKYTQSLSVTLKPLGYDISGVSDDLTDYRGYNPGLPGFVPNTQFRIDPISQYTFQKLTPFNTLSNSYFPPNNKNAILSPITNAPYTYKTNSNAEIKIVQWYDGYSIPQQKQDNFQALDNISSAITSSFQDLLLGRTTRYSVDQNGNIQFGQGIYAIGFLPQDGLYLVSSFTFKSVLYPITGTSANSEDPNMQIQHIGIFQGSYIANTSILTLANALEVLTKINTETYAPDTLSNTPQFGVEFGTYYTFGYDPSYVPVNKINLNGYTQSSNQLLSYDAMYYAVAFDGAGSNITFSRLAGTIVPYPLSQVPSTSSSYFGQTSKSPSGTLPQYTYFMPSTIKNANAEYGPQNGYAYTQSQYEQSQPITTTSIGYRDYGLLTNNTDAFFTFSVTFSTSIGTLSPAHVGLNTFVTEYDSKLWVVNSLSNNSTLSNAGLTFTGAKYASSLNTIITNTTGGTVNSIRYLVNQPSTLQNYTYSRTSTIFSVFNYTPMSEPTNTSTTTQSFTLQPNSPNITVWLWGGGGGSIPSTVTDIYGYQPYGGAGGYVKATINVQQLYSIYGQSNSTISVVVGKGGNRDNFTFTASTASLNYAQVRYGGGGTSIASTINPDILNGSSHTDDILPQGGGFSGLFLGSNILTAIPLLIVGGGGAGGAYSLGGPGGFGVPAITYSPSSFYQFSTVTINTTVSLQVPFSGVQDVDNIAVYPGSPITAIIDGNLGTTWNPTGSPYLQPTNFTPTNQTYRVNFQFSSNVSTLSKLRYYGPNQGDAVHPPTGFVVYNNQLKTQVLYSNAAITYANYSAVNNGTFGLTPQLYFDMPITSSIQNTTVVTAGYVMTGNAIAASNVIQYSIDGSNWFPANTNGYRFNPVDARYAGIGLAVKYGNGIWLASGYGQSLSLTNIGATWSPVLGAYGWRAFAMSASGKYQIAVTFGYKPFFSTNFGASFSAIASLGTYNWNAAAISATGQYIVIAASGSIAIYISNNYGATFTTTFGSAPYSSLSISASGKYIWIVATNYGVWTSNNFGSNWSGVGYSVSAVAVSGSGQYVTLISGSGNGVYVSSDYGVSWVNTRFGYNLNGISMSSSGKYQLIAGNNFCYISSNYGVSFTTSTISTQIGTATFMSSAMSATGHYMLIGSANIGFIISTNFGSTWTVYGPTPRVQAYMAAMSADGKYMLLGPYTGQAYQSIATTPTVTYPYIMYSTDGINWNPTTITEYDGAYIRSLSYISSTGLWIAGGASGTYGSFLCSTDGLNWNFGGISNPYIGGESISIRLLNGSIWSTGNGDATGKNSIDGFTWSNVAGINGSYYDITYGNGYYVATGFNASAPYYSGIIYSADGITWYAAIGTFTSLNFFGLGVTFGATTLYPSGVFIAVGLYANVGSTVPQTTYRTYYSLNATNWYPTNENVVAGLKFNQSIRGIVYGNSRFVSVGEGPQQYPQAPNIGANQISVKLSSDGINWTYGLTGGYAPGIYTSVGVETKANECALAIDYGTITSIPNLSTLYMEIQKTTQNTIYMYELQAYGPATALLPQAGTFVAYANGNTFPTVGTTITIKNIGAYNWSSVLALDSVGTTYYNAVYTVVPGGTLSFVLANTIPNGGYVQVQVADVGGGILNKAIYNSSGVITVTILALYGSPNYDIGIISSAGNTISNIIDNNLTTFYWPSELQTVGITSYPFVFTVSTPITQVNHLQVYSPLSNLHLLTGLAVATDTNGPLATVTSLATTNFSTINDVYLYDISFIPTLSNISTLTLTVGKTTTSSLQLTEVTPYYNPNNAATQYLPTSVTDLDTRGGIGGLTLQTIISGSLNLNSYWNVNTWNLTLTTQILRLTFTFNNVTQLNHMQVYSDIYGGLSTHMINGIGVYLDSTKSVVLYSNASPTAIQYRQFMYYDFDITSCTNITSLYVELSKTTANPNYQPWIYQVAFYNIGLLPGTLGGLTGGLLNTIKQQQSALLIENGGGGTIAVGGTGGNGGALSASVTKVLTAGDPFPSAGTTILLSNVGSSSWYTLSAISVVRSVTTTYYSGSISVAPGGTYTFTLASVPAGLNNYLQISVYANNTDSITENFYNTSGIVSYSIVGGGGTNPVSVIIPNTTPISYYFGLTGSNYIGGNPAIYSGNAQYASTFTYMSSIAGGGGGGYYGGGGGGTIATFPTTQSTYLGNYGGAGGGGAGFFSTIASSGGSITNTGTRIFHTFTSSGTFTALPNTPVEIFLVGGGGGGGGWYGGGGGAGNIVILTTTLAAGSYNVTVGAGGAGGKSAYAGVTGYVGVSGQSTSFGSIATALGGGGGATANVGKGVNGGSGGGGTSVASTSPPGAAVLGTVYSGTTVQNLAKSGGSGPSYGNTGGAGGGGATTVGSNGTVASPVGGNGGAGFLYYGNYYGGGGGGSAGSTVWGTPVIGTGGIGGGGNGGMYGPGTNGSAGNPAPQSGTPNTGGGGGGNVFTAGGALFTEAGSGGSGIVIVSYTVNYSPMISVVEYGIATVGTGTPSNYITPGIYQQSTFIGYNLLTNSGFPYGYGGQPGTTGPTGGLGGHGLVVLSYDTNITVTPLNTNTASTFLTDASKLSLFQTPIDTTASVRSLTFGTYTEQIQTTTYSNYNWVWYSSYLSLTGGTLSSTLTATIGAPVFPINTYPNLPTPVYNNLADQFNNVSTFYNGQKTTVLNAKTITDIIQFMFQVFQNYFVVTPYTSSKYVEFTKIYCLLDYLQDQNNLLYPHVNPTNATLDRIFGGVPGFGYWANPFLTNTSFVGFDIGPSLTPPSSLVGIIGASSVPTSVQAMYGLVIEQNLSTGSYTLKDIMSFKPNSTDIGLYGSNWAKASQFNESFVIRNPESVNMDGYISVQPYDFKNAINGRLSLFNYKTYYTNIVSGGTVIPSPIHMINDFEGSQAFFYSYQNSNTANYSSIFITHYPITSTLITLNNQNILDRSNNTTTILGTAISEYTTATYRSTSINIVNKFGYATTTPTNYYPKINIYQGSNAQGLNSNYYNSFSLNSPISSVNVGRLINDYNGNIYSSDRLGTTKIYENVCTIQIYMQEFTKEKLAFASPSFVLSQYNSGNKFPYTDFFQSKYANMWHLQGSPNMSTLYGVRLQSPFDFTITTNFINQIFYPTHKITLLKKGAGQNPITQTTDLVNSSYPWYPHTEMFFYNNYSTMMYDISGQFAKEQTSNFTNADQFSGYFFDSFINNINLEQSTYYNNNNADSFYYLAVRAYSPSEQFKCLLRMSLPGRYDFGFVTIADLSNESVTIQLPGAVVNPDYANVLTQFNTPFTFTSKTFGSTGLPGYSGSNISSIQFGDFLRQYITIYNSIQTNTVVVSSVSGVITTGIANLIAGDLQYILPSTLINRSRSQDPLQFALYFSTFVNPANQSIDEYGLGYNLGFARADTGYNSIQRATSFFKILDDYIYLQMNPEYNMNRLDVSRQENFSATQDPTSEAQLYNCKLLLNTFGSYAQTVVQNPVFFNPPIGKLDKLSFQWFDVTGTLINNADCEWSAVLQITESVMVATAGSTLPST